MDLKKLLYKRADTKNINIMLEIIHRCMKEVNYIDYSKEDFQKYLSSFTVEWLKNINYYEVWYNVMSHSKLQGLSHVTFQFAEK